MEFLGMTSGFILVLAYFCRLEFSFFGMNCDEVVGALGSEVPANYTCHTQLIIFILIQPSYLPCIIITYVYTTYDIASTRKIQNSFSIPDYRQQTRMFFETYMIYTPFADLTN